MSLQDNLYRNFPVLQRLFKKKPVAASLDEDAAPGSMDLKPDGTHSVVAMNKKPLLIAGGIILVAVGAGYVSFASMRHKAVVAAPKLHLARSNAVSLPNAPQPGLPKAPEAASSLPVRGAQAPSAQATAKKAAPNAQSQPTPQQQATLAALGGGQTGGSGWGSAQGSQGSARAAVSPVSASPAQASVTPTAISQPNDQSGLGVYDTHLVRKPASPYEIMQGSVIPATLTTGIESDLPGQITAVVSRNVFDSASGDNLLVPAGAQLVGTYLPKVLPGQSSVGVVWNRILFPNGSYVNLGVMEGADPNGMSGLTGEVNDHTWLMFKNALLLSLVSTGMAKASGASSTTSTNPSTSQLFTQQFAQTFGQAVSQVLQRYTQIAPTIHVQPGDQLSVVVSKDIVFNGPYASAMQAVAQPVRATAPAAMINPYPKASQ